MRLVHLLQRNREASAPTKDTGLFGSSPKRGVGNVLAGWDSQLFVQGPGMAHRLFDPVWMLWHGGPFSIQ